MSNQYKSFYLNDIIAIINQAAISCMKTPASMIKKVDGTMMTLAEMANHNGTIAFHNDGVRELAERLKEALQKDGEPDE